MKKPCDGCGTVRFVNPKAWNDGHGRFCRACKGAARTSPAGQTAAALDRCGRVETVTIEDAKPAVAMNAPQRAKLIVFGPDHFMRDLPIRFGVPELEETIALLHDNADHVAAERFDLSDRLLDAIAKGLIRVERADAKQSAWNARPLF